MSTDEWRRLARRRLFFGHQSVGENLMEGVREVLEAHSGIPVRVIETQDISRMQEAGLYHARVGRNGAPQTKLDVFAKIVGGVSGPQTALVKFCYVDITHDTDPEALFDAYRRTVEGLKASDPDLQIVHVTIPLTADPGLLFHLRTVLRGNGSKSLRRLNSLREEYNHTLRAAYRGREPVFDLAQLESVGPDGNEATVRYRGIDVPVLAAAWTYDGGHLNPEARRRMAEALLVTLAKL